MIHYTSARSRSLLRQTLLLALVFCLASPLFAQFPPGGFGGGGGNQSRSTAGKRQYPNNNVGDAVISIDPETRSLIVISDEDTGQYISQVVSNLDRPQPQVLIKVVFLEVAHNDATDIGIEGTYNNGSVGNPLTTGFITNFTVFNPGGSNATVVPSSVTPITSSLMGMHNFGLASAGNPQGLYQVFQQDFTVTLRAIAMAGKARVLSRPSVIARNNQPATITVGQSVPLITNVRFDNFGNAINSITYQAVGIILRVTPFVTGEGLVQMILSPESSQLVSDRTQWVPISSGPNGTVSAPIINSRSADTVIVTPTGQTVIIGGLMENVKGESVTKIPVLGDIPYLGYLFRHKVTTDTKTELLIFLTPYIILAPTEMAAISDRVRAQSGAEKALTEKELEKFLDKIPQAPDQAPGKPWPKSNSSKEGSNY